MLNLRIARGPLPRIENEAILEEYNRLTSSRIPIGEFVHWVQNGPAGPAWHAILETDDAQIVGHTSFIPFRGDRNGRRITPAKSEYTFLREEFRAAKIRGFEKSGRPTWLIFADQLHRHCSTRGWEPLFVSTTPVLQRFFASIGCQRADFPLWECLLVLRPWSAARKTPNLRHWQRLLLWVTGLFQRIGWSLFLLFCPRPTGTRLVPIDDGSLPKANGSLTFFQDQDSLRWRYLEGQYKRLALDGEGNEYVISKKGSADRYLRVCQWRLGSNEPAVSLIARLVQMAQEEKALGVRWAVYGDDKDAAKFARCMRRLGFLCARRVRTLLIYPKEQSAATGDWHLTDAMFSFDP